MTIRQHRILKAVKQLLLKKQKQDSSESLYDCMLISFHSGAEGLKRCDTEDIVIFELYELAALGFLKVGGRREDTQYALGICITRKGVVAEGDFWRDTLFFWLKNIIIPAAVSIVVSLISYALIN